MPIPGAVPPTSSFIIILSSDNIQSGLHILLNAFKLTRNNKMNPTLQTELRHAAARQESYFYRTLGENIESLWRSDKVNIPGFLRSRVCGVVEAAGDVLLRMARGGSWLFRMTEQPGSVCSAGYGVGLSIISRQGRGGVTLLPTQSSF
jgi:hypothetical protein